MLTITRQYVNAADETIRVDEIFMVRTSNTLARAASEHTFQRQITTTNIYGPADRVVSSLVLIGNFTFVEPSSGDFLYAEWTSPATICDMTDLPGLTDTV